MNILFRNKNQKEFLKYVDEYININSASCRYTNCFIKYSLLYIKNLSNDLSFILIENKKPLALAFIPIEKFNRKKTISLNSGYIQGPLAINDKIEKEVFNQIDLIANKYSVSKIKFFIDPLITRKNNYFNNLRKYNYFDTTSSSCLLDLKKSCDELWKGIRRGHQYDINKIIKNKDFKIIKIDHKNLDKNIHQKYVTLHHKCAGKITRSKKTFDLQFEMIKKNQATIFGLIYKDKAVSFCYFFHFKSGVLYASAADDPDFVDYPVYHALIWKAIEYYRNHRFEYLDFCEPCGYGIQFDQYLDEKQKNISRFKRGFGGQMIPVFKGIKYFNKKLFEKDVIEFTKQYSEEIYHHL